MMWLTIVQGLATHIRQQAEHLRRKFVSHSGKLKITVRRDDFIKGSPENPWNEVLGEFSRAIREHIGNAHGLIVADFSTTGAVERAASEAALLDAMQCYFEYEVVTVCGIPSLTLEGTADDWRSIAARVERFSEFGLGWWVKAMRPVLAEFAAAANGIVRREFWDSIYKYPGRRGSGTPYVSGWISVFFPYLRDGRSHYTQNPWLAKAPPPGGPRREQFPSLPSSAPFQWTIGVPELTDRQYKMAFIGGLIGVAQDPDSLGLRPEIGWAVRDTAARFKRDEIPNWESETNLLAIL